MKMKALVIGGIAVTAALAGGWALAQTVSPGLSGFGPRFTHGKDGMGSGMMEHMGKGMGHGMMKGHGMVKGTGPDTMHGRRGSGLDPAQIAALKTELGITPAQEPAWSKYAKAVQDAAAAMKTAREGVDPETIGKMNPADRLRSSQGCVSEAKSNSGRNRVPRHARRQPEGESHRHSPRSRCVRPRDDARRRYGRTTTSALSLAT